MLKPSCDMQVVKLLRIEGATIPKLYQNPQQCMPAYLFTLADLPS